MKQTSASVIPHYVKESGNAMKISKTASTINGYWIGLCNNNSVQCSGNCPAGLCTSKISVNLDETIGEVHKLMCNSNRERKLCGKCTTNYSVYYHSDSLCDEESVCNYGILF